MSNVNAWRRGAVRRIRSVPCALLGALLLASLSSSASAQELVFVDFLDGWNYRLGTSAPSNPATAWREPGFDDSSWVQDAPTPIGYGSGVKQIRTLLPTSEVGGYVSVYFRTTFQVANPNAITGLSAELEFDDGFVLYINGVEAARHNMGAVGTELDFDDTSTGGHEFDDLPNTFDLGGAIDSLVAGTNLIAIELHNTSATSSDILLNARIVGSTDVGVLCPDGLTCQRRTNGVALSWTNDPGVNYTGIRVTRDGTPIPGSPFPGTTESVFDTGGGGAPHDYAVTASIGVFTCAALTCSTTDSVAVVAEGDDWTYFRGTEEPAPEEGTGAATLDWIERGFDDSAWEVGPTGIGYGDNDDATELDDMEDGYTTVYARHVFSVASAAALDDLALVIDYDDAFVAYLNGVEIARSAGAGGAGTILAFDATSTVQREAGSAEIIPIADGTLVNGENILAVQGLNTDIGSSDFSLIPTLVTNPDLGAQCPDPASLVCMRLATGVQLDWQLLPGATYDRIEVFRNGSEIALSPLAGDATSVVDSAGRSGDDYEVVAFVGDFECPPLECTVGSEISVVALGEEWAFFRGSEEPTPDAGDGSPTTEWADPGYDDSAWERGPSGFGYGDGDDATVLDDMEDGYTSVYIRKAFSVPSPAALPDLYLAVDYDDGFVAYLNGVEIARAGVVEDPPAFDATATSHEAGTPVIYTVDVGLLDAGDNVLALHGLNTGLGSSDFSLAPALYSGICAPVQDLACTADPDAGEVTLTWDTTLHDEFIVLRNGFEIPGSPFSGGVAVDTSPGDGDAEYQVIGVRGASACPAAMCTVACADLYPDALSCTASVVGGATRVDLAWTIDPAGTAFIDVLREGQIVANLDSSATSFSDPDVEATGPEADTDYVVRFLDADGDLLCSISCGALSLCPENLVCETIEEDGAVRVELTWENIARPWDSFTLLQNGVEVAVGIAPDATAYVLDDAALEPGIPVTFTLVPVAFAGETSPCADLTCDTVWQVLETATYDAPAGGWDYRIDFDAGDDAYQATTLVPGNLDGSWIRAANDSWDGSAPLEVGAAPDGAAPGGVGVEPIDGLGECGSNDSVLRILDPGDPSAPGASLATEYPDPYDAPNNRVLVLGLDLGVADANLLREGITFAARWRLNPDAPAYMAAGAQGDGSPVTDGLGQIGVAFVDDGSLGTAGNPASLGLTLNSGDLLQATTNPVQGLAAAAVTTFRSVWVTVEDPEADGSYAVTLYTNGQTEAFTAFLTSSSLTLQQPNVDFGDAVGNYLVLALANGGNDADIQVDWVAYKEGVHAPSATPCAPCDNAPPVARITTSPSSTVSLVGGTAAVTLGGTTSDNGEGGAVTSWQWSKVSGPAGDTIAAPNASSTGVTFTAAGSYVYRLRVGDGATCNNSAAATVTITVQGGGGGIEFRRGDVDGAGGMAITDAIAIFNFLFIGIGQPPRCPDAADADDDGTIGITDGIRILNVLFQGVGEIPAPGFSNCGADPSADGLGACVYDGC